MKFETLGALSVWSTKHFFYCKNNLNLSKNIFFFFLQNIVSFCEFISLSNSKNGI